MLNWYALYTKPHSELQVERALTVNGIETYFPAIPAPRRTGRSPVRPFFPCYLFAHTDLDRVGLSILNRTPGMRRVVAFADTPARVDDAIIAAMRQRLERPLTLDERGEMMEPGDRVVVTSGPFQDLDAIFDKRLSAAGRARVLVQLMRRWTAVEIQADTLRKVSTGPYRANGPRTELKG